MNDVLNKIKGISEEGCVTLILNTHRTSPDNKRDPITLKNLLKEAEERLGKELDKKKASAVFSNLQKAADKVDHSYNLESLLVFANENISEFARLPVSVQDRVIIDNNFATRDMIRAVHQETNYYVLTVSRRNARLIKVFNDRPVKEFKDDNFPFENDQHYSTDKHRLTMAKGTDNLYEEFFNKVDKRFQSAAGSQLLPVIICTEERNFHHYKKMMDNPDRILGHLNMNRDEEPAHKIAADAWPIAKKAVEERNAERIKELNDAVGAGNFLSDFNDIWRAVNEGRGRTLFVKKGLFQPARINGNDIELKTESDIDSPDVIDDVVDEMIERNIAKGGDNVFIKGNELDKFNNIALLTRY